jgi:REP element-mobilizing transposase RayT
MGQSLAQNYIHIIFSVKNRKPLIHESIEQELFQYIGGLCKNLESTPLEVGGYKNHIHILCTLSKKLPLATLIQKVKSRSSKWIKPKGPEYKNFYWQNGYGAFSISSSKVESVRSYIKKQKEHHRNMSFEEEYKDMLKENNVEFDARYIWD